MPMQELFPIPQERADRPWPFLEPTAEEHRLYFPDPQQVSILSRMQQQQQQNIWLSGVWDALWKGCILGLLLFGLISGLLLHLDFWFSAWHWAFALFGLSLLVIFVGPKVSSFLVTIALILFGPIAVIQQHMLLPYLAGSLIICSLLKILFEVLP